MQRLKDLGSLKNFQVYLTIGGSEIHAVSDCCLGSHASTVPVSARFRARLSS